MFNEMSMSMFTLSRWNKLIQKIGPLKPGHCLIFGDKSWTPGQVYAEHGSRAKWLKTIKSRKGEWEKNSDLESNNSLLEDVGFQELEATGIQKREPYGHKE